MTAEDCAHQAVTRPTILADVSHNQCAFQLVHTLQSLYGEQGTLSVALKHV